MTTYAKLDKDGTLDTLTRVPNVSNPLPATVEAYANAHGYKPVRYAESPGRYYRSGYTETEESIVQVWVPWELEEARADALGRVQGWVDGAVDPRPAVSVPCGKLGFPLVYDRQAGINLMRLDMKRSGAPVFIAADNTVHALTADEVSVAADTLDGYVGAVYERATLVRGAIAAAVDVDAVEAAVRNLNDM